MDGRSDRRARDRRAGLTRGVVAAGLTLGVLSGLTAGRAGASTIRGHHLIVVTGVHSLGPAWARFLSGGQGLWEVGAPPRFPSGLVLPTSLGRLVETPFVDYLLWRRSLDPARFDHYHPNVGPELGAFVPAVRAVPAHTTAGGGRTHLFHPTPQNLPEPATFWIALALIGAGVATRVRISVRAATAHR